MKHIDSAHLRFVTRMVAVLGGAALLCGSVALAAPPANDECAGAIAIPDGPFPLLTAPVAITDATPQGSEDPVFACADTDRTIWYSFTPSVTADYAFTTCAGNGATGSTVYDTVLAVLDSTGGACPSTASLACNDTNTACTQPIPGAPYLDQATVGAIALVGGHTYFVVVGHWSGDAGGVAPGFDQITIAVDLLPPPANDTCSAPAPLELDRVIHGTTIGASDDYQSQSSAACFSGIGQTLTSSPGRDVVFSFVAPAAASYSFRYVQDDPLAVLRSQNPVLYAASACPSSGTVSCLKGANRSLVNGPATPNRSEEIDCLAMTGGETVYVFFDDGASGNGGGPLAIEVHACNAEAESNDTPATANAYGACYTTGATNPTGDVDVFDLGTPPAGSKVFAAIDALTTNNVDFELRVTTATDTLQYDDNDGTIHIGLNAPVIAGTPTTGAQTFLRVNHKAAGSPAEPYHLYARVETGSPQAEVETPDNDEPASGNLIVGGGFVAGSHATTTDMDCFRFVAHEGDDIAMFTNNNPARAAGTIVDSWPVLSDLIGGPPMDTLFGVQILRNNLTPSPGTLTGTTPSITSEFWDYRARYTGTYFVCFYPIAPTFGFPRPYEGSISLNCGAIPDPSSRITDVAVTMAGPAGPVNTGAFIETTVTLTNTGTDIAQDVRLVHTLSAQLVFVSLTADDGFSGNNGTCTTLPAPGTAGGTVDCTNFSLAPGASTTFTIAVQTANCSAAGANVHGEVAITTASTDPNAANDAGGYDFTTSTDGSCADIACDGNGCVPNLCTTGDHCVGSVCVNTPLDCDDGNACTDDACVPATAACVNAADDGNTCSDGDLCTTLDACHAGACLGDDLDCNVSCPPGFLPVDGLCQKTYDIDETLLDNLNGYCDGTGENHVPGLPNDNLCTGGNYGFHWVDTGGSLPSVSSVSVQLEAGVRTGSGPSTVTLNGVAAGSFTNTAGSGACNSPHQTIALSGLDVGNYTQGGLNSISITPAFASFCEGLSKAANLGSHFARVTVRYLPGSQPSGVCKAGSCDTGSGTCTFADLADDTACDDGDACNGVETCQNLPLATCTGGPPPDCDDGSGCTNDSCSSSSGCIHAPIDCSDGDGCTFDSCSDPSGCQHTATCVEGGSQTASAGGTVSTDSEADGATQSDQIETSVTTPSGGLVSIVEGPAAPPVPGGYDLIDLQSVITAPAATSTDPLVLSFRIDVTALPSGYVLGSLTIFRNGVAVGDCIDGSGDAAPDPCVSSRAVLGDGDVQVTVLTSQASIWKFGFPSCDDGNACTADSGAYPSCAHVNLTGSCDDGNACTQTDTCVAGVCTGGNLSWSGVLQPINPDGTSVFKLGSTIPVKFELTGACDGNTNLVANIYFYKVSNSEGPVNEAASNGSADTGIVFRYVSASDQYVYNLGTKGLTQGTWNLGIDLHDGVGIRVVSVGLRK